MRTLAAAIAVLAVGCATPSSESPSGKHELGLNLTRVSETEVVGTLETQVGSVSFEARVTESGVFDIKFDRSGRVLSSHVDWNKLENELAISGDAEITTEDRFVLKALSTVLEDEVGKTTKVTDNLVRQAALWGGHPEGKLAIAHIKADPARGWTTLCNGTSYRNFYHDTGSHGLSGEYLKYGPGETSNPCRSRCGWSCYSVGTSAWTVDCGNHDRCEQLHSSGCGDEWTSASDDFTFAGNCSY
jgi:hypothetical protein